MKSSTTAHVLGALSCVMLIVLIARPSGLMFVALVVLIILWLSARSSAATAARRAALLAKYGDPEIVERIMRRTFWQGQTADQLRDSLGAPAAMDEKILKASTRHVYKYRQTGANRYALRVTVENDLVTGWDQKE